MRYSKKLMDNLTDDEYSDDFFSSRHHHHESNITIKTSVTIRVTPYDDYYLSWIILWSCFVFVSLIILGQVIRERKITRSQQTQVDDVEQSSQTVGDGDLFSSADITRCIFRRILLLAMLARVLFIPVQVLSNPVWWQFVSDTLPEMIFASAWSLLVTFVVQLCGIAMGMGTSATPGIVIQATAYIVYILLICMQYYNYVASVLLYALLCCIYAALFGIVFYFFPRLVSLLRPTLERHRGLSARIFICTILCLIVFGAHTIGYARCVVAPPRRVYWWWNYGALELLPAIIFAVLMQPKNNKAPRVEDESNLRSNDSPEDFYGNRKPGATGIKRSDSASGRRIGETAALLRPATNYGASSSTPPPTLLH